MRGTQHTNGVLPALGSQKISAAGTALWKFHIHKIIMQHYTNFPDVVQKPAATHGSQAVNH